MPIAVKDYTWKENNDCIFITVPLKGVLSKKVDILSTEDYVKVSFELLLALPDWRQCGNSLALCYFAVVMELPDSLWMNCKSEFGVIFLRFWFWFWFILRRAHFGA